jgi:methyl-accepting chemotaxis protein
MEITISINQIITFFLYTAAFAVLVYLTISIRNINFFLKELRLLVETNRKNIDSTMDSIPVIASDIKNITGDFREGVVIITKTAEDIQKNLSDSSNTVLDKTEIAIEYIQVVGQVVKTGLDYFNNKKRKRKKR